MKHLLLFISLSLFTSNCLSQEELPSNLKPYFTALIVSDLESSIDWYSENFNFEVTNRLTLENRGFKQANLKTENFLLELIEIEGTFDPKKEIETNPNYKYVKGIFKIGFQVKNIDSWVVLLKNKKVDFYGDIVNDPHSGSKMVIIKDPDGNYIQLFEN